MVDSNFFEQIQQFLPKYLTPQEQHDLYDELKSFPDNFNFYFDRTEYEDQLLQGDGWRGFVAINFFTGDRKSVTGMVLSNSCDVSIENERSRPVNILFAPILRLSRYEELLKHAGRSNDQIASTFDSIRKQRVSDVFYLPPHKSIIEESIVILDDIHAHPISDFLDRPRESLFTLTLYGFYLFLIKLSIHFSRFQEQVRRK